MTTSRGCPFQCIFCTGRQLVGAKIRSRNAKSVVDEMQLCSELGVSEFLIYDATFTVRRQRVIDICAEIEEVFGEAPNEVHNLGEVMVIRRRLKALT